MMKNIRFCISLVLLLWMGRAQAQYCTNDTRYTEAVFFDSTELTLLSNLQYGIANDFQGNPDTLLLDLYYPKLNVDPSPKRPFVMLMHGGGFSSGDKQLGDIRDLCIHLAMRGFVCASINYRLGDAFTEYGQLKARYRAIQDGHAAFRYIVENAATARIDTNWLFVGGQSAGSICAHGVVYGDPTEFDSVSLQYGATAISSELGNLYTSGNTLTHGYTIKGMFNNWGGAVQSEVDVEEMIPAVAFHGELDSTVRIDSDTSFAHYSLEGSRSMHAQLMSHNICSELTVDTTGGHGIYRNASSVFRARRASCFFKSVFCSNCSSLYTLDSIAPNCSVPLSVPPHSAIQNTVSAYPNPFETRFQLRGTEGPTEITLMNPIGQVIYRGNHADQIPLFDLMPGLYLLRVDELETGKITSLKLIKR